MAKSSWLDPLPDDGVSIVDRPEPGPDFDGRVDFLYFGADPCWSPAREAGMIGRKVAWLCDRQTRRVYYREEMVGLDIEWACDLASREVLIVEACGNCRSGFGPRAINDRVPCAACLETTKDARIAHVLASHPVPLPDAAANAALAVVAADLCECEFVRSIEVATAETKDRANVVLIKTCRKLKRHERLGLPREVDGIRVEVREPGKRRTHQGEAA